jgi:hypothetical protein
MRRSYDWAGNNVNVTFDAASAGAVQNLHVQALHFFSDPPPVAHRIPSAAPPALLAQCGVKLEGVCQEEGPAAGCTKEAQKAYKKKTCKK